MKPSVLRRLVNIWPPIFFTGIKTTRISEDFREIDVTLKLRWYNKNYVGTQFGGSLMSMTDPWYMLMLMHNLDGNYYVWDKSAEIDYIAPGRTHVHAQFRLTQERINSIIDACKDGKKSLPEFTVDIVDDHGKLVARVKRVVYVRLKPKAREEIEEV